MWSYIKKITLSFEKLATQVFFNDSVGNIKSVAFFKLKLRLIFALS